MPTSMGVTMGESAMEQHVFNFVYGSHAKGKQAGRHAVFYKAIFLVVLLSVLILPSCINRSVAPRLSVFDPMSAPAGVLDAHRRLVSPVIVRVNRLEGPSAERRASSSESERRLKAARSLLATRHAAAPAALAAALDPAVPWVARQAVLRAVATTDDALPSGLWRPLAHLLTEPVPSELASDLGPALGRFNRAELRRYLAAGAVDETKPLAIRSQFIDALAHQREPDAAATLLGLTRRAESSVVQDAAFVGLATLTGREDLGRDRRGWEAWWAEASKLNSSAWHQALVSNFTRLRAEQQQADGRVADRLVALERAYYQASDTAQRPGVLIAMLGSPLRESRLLALDLAQNRLVEDAGLDESLRVVLRSRLTDVDAHVRARAAIVLRDAADATAADMAAARLMDGSEPVVAVQSAFLRLLARLPRKQATSMVLDLLDDPVLRADAAGALGATARAGQLAPRQAVEAQERLRQILTPGLTAVSSEEGADLASSGDPPLISVSSKIPAGLDSPQLVALLGQVGDNSDWQRIEHWLDSDDPVIQQAAAQAWADLGRSLTTLAERADDPVIQPIVLRAAERDGQDAATLQRLAALPPSALRLIPAWERALVAMSGRVTPNELWLVLTQLDAARPDSDLERDRVLRERMLTAALDRGLKVQEPQRAYLNLRLARAQARRAAGEPDLAVSDFEKLLLDVDVLEPRRIEQLYRGLIPAYLDANRHQDAMALAEVFLKKNSLSAPGSPVKPNAIVDDPLLYTFVKAGRRAVELGRPGVGHDLLEGIRSLCPLEGPAISDNLAERLAELEDALAPPKRNP